MRKRIAGSGISAGIRYHSGLRRSVSMVPTAIRFARMPYGPSSIAIALISPYRPCLDAAIAAVCRDIAVIDALPPKAIMVPLLRSIIPGVSGLGQIESRVEVHGENLMPFFVAELPQWPVRPHADHAHQHVDLAEPLRAQLHHPVDFLGLAYVCRMGNACTPKSSHSLATCFTSSACSRDQDKVGPLAGKGQGYRFTMLRPAPEISAVLPLNRICDLPMIFTRPDAGILDYFAHPVHFGFYRGRKLLRRAADDLCSGVEKTLLSSRQV